MDKFLKVVKFGLDNRAAILSVWILIAGIIGGTGYIASQKPVEQIKRSLPIPEPVNVMTPPLPPKSVPREPIDYSKVRQIATEVCEKINHDHERQYHFVDNN